MKKSKTIDVLNDHILKQSINRFISRLYEGYINEGVKLEVIRELERKAHSIEVILMGASD